MTPRPPKSGSQTSWCSSTFLSFLFLSLNADDSITQNSGLNIGIDPSNQLKGAYGWGGTTERGFIPMPGITGASVKYENNGALTKTEIQIKCYSKTQLALVDALYMRPGYTVLLEFGWSAYLKTNNGDDLLTTPIEKTEESPVKLVNAEPFLGQTGPLRYLLKEDDNKQNINWCCAVPSSHPYIISCFIIIQYMD